MCWIVDIFCNNAVMPRALSNCKNKPTLFAYIVWGIERHDAFESLNPYLVHFFVGSGFRWRHRPVAAQQAQQRFEYVQANIIPSIKNLRTRSPIFKAMPGWSTGTS